MIKFSKSALQLPMEGASCCASPFNASCPPHNEWQGTQVNNNTQDNLIKGHNSPKIIT